MSLLRLIKAQLGLSNTPANNFHFDASADDGTLKLRRGNADAPAQDILTVDAAGKVAFPQSRNPNSGPFAIATKTSGNVPGTSGNPDVIASLIIDSSDSITYSAGRFTPQVAGWYSASTFVTFSGGTVTAGLISIRKNGSFIASNASPPYSGSSVSIGCACDLVYMNGTTDYLEVFVGALFSVSTPVVSNFRVSMNLVRT